MKAAELDGEVVCSAEGFGLSEALCEFEQELTAALDIHAMTGGEEDRFDAVACAEACADG
jgi:hypothetical protein